MAKIWPIYEGREPTRGEPWADLPVRDAAVLFKLKPSDFVSDLETTPLFGDKDRDKSFSGYQHVVVEIGDREGRNAGWRPGFYRSRLKPKEAFAELVRLVLEPELGRTNVVRVRPEPSADSVGEAAWRINVVIDPRAIKKLSKGASLDALIELRKRLSGVGDERTPLFHYATEADLAHNAGR
jgi:hypothetical protein